MTARFVVTGTDTGIGKTVFAAAFADALGAAYWKPIQAGIADGTDSATVADLAPRATVLPEGWRLTLPASPHLAAERDGVTIDPAALVPPPGPLVIEGAGGALVPVTRDTVFADIFAQWQIPVVICARTTLGTINHSLMTVEALERRGVPIHGIAFIGDPVPDSEEIICTLGRVRRLGRLPHLDPLTPAALAAGFAQGFSLTDFA
jgi:dethiobiotin synthetase